MTIFIQTNHSYFYRVMGMKKTAILYFFFYRNLFLLFLQKFSLIFPHTTAVLIFKV